ncbi:MAG: DUF4249 domain-containing protein [Cyclobacteriaceae bacterium]
MKQFIFIFSILFLLSCDDIITVELDDPQQAIIIDAWLTHTAEDQHIHVTRSQPYFENEFPTKISGASVFVIDSIGIPYIFEETAEGYTWANNTGQPFGTIGDYYALVVNVDGEQFNSWTQLKRVPSVDSIKFTYEPADNFITSPFYIAEFVATDPVGPGDTYWIKTWKNGQQLNKPSELNYVFDAGGSEGNIVDGQVFIQPVQNAINPFDENPDEENTFLPPYSVDDSVYVEIHSISPIAYYFLLEVSIQTNRDGGFAALFAQPVANVSTNIFNANENSKVRAYGFFNVAAVSSLGQRLSPEIAAEAKRLYDEEL